VASSRKKSAAEIEPIADGRILTGRQALDSGLLDALGDLDYAIKRAAARAGIEGKPRVITIQPRKGLLQRFSSPFTIYGQQAAVRAGLSGIPLWMLPTF
jgi:protease IV